MQVQQIEKYEKISERPTSKIEVLLRHPGLVTQLPFGQIKSKMKHIEYDLADAQKIWKKYKLESFGKVVRAYESHCKRPSILYALMRMYQPKVMIETGVQNGVSSAFILQGMHDNGFGHLYSIDLPNALYAKDQEGLHDDLIHKGGLSGYLVPAYLRNQWNLILGDAKIELPKLINNLEKIDCFIHDSEHTHKHMTFELESAYSAIQKGIILCDDIHWNEAFNDFCKRHLLRSIQFDNIGLVQKQ